MLQPTRIDGPSANAVAVVTDLDFRRAMRCWPSGVAVVTSVRDHVPHGMTASSFTSVSLDPPLVSVCVARTARTFSIIAQSRRFVVNVLASNQATLAQRFAARTADQSRFEAPPRLGSNGCPLIDGAVMQVECNLYAQHDAGDHVIVIGMVTRSHVHDGNPILYCKGEFGAVAAMG